MSELIPEEPLVINTKFHIDDWQVTHVTEHDDHGIRQKYKHVYAFVKNNQAMTRHDLKETFQSIRDILNEQSVNCGILMFAHGTYVFTEVPVNLNPVMFKLASGINFHGEVTDGFGNLSEVNARLGR